jgi:MFS family permease
VFAVYVLALLVALLMFGSLSDYLGRRRVILGGRWLAGAGACGLFLAAHGVWAAVRRPGAAGRRGRHRDQRGSARR